MRDDSTRATRGKGLEGSYDTESAVFLTREEPSELAIGLEHALSKRGFGGNRDVSIAGLGSGNGRDELFFAERGYRVVAFDIRPEAREDIAARFGQHGLRHRLEVHEDYSSPSRIAEGSLVGVNALSSLHYLPPKGLVSVLRTYGPLLHDDGVAAIGLKTPDASWPREHVAAGKPPEQIYSLAGLVREDLNGDGNVPAYRDNGFLRCYYTQRQVESLARAAGYRVLDISHRTIRGYDRQGHDERFVFAFLGKGGAR